MTSRSAPNGVTSSYGYDDLNRLTSLMHTAGATTLSGNLYTYNDANNISSWTTATDQRAYTYDAVDRLTGVSNFESPTESYTYDAVGNRTASHLSATYGYQGFNKLTSTTSATYSYDSNGNLISKTDSLGTWTSTYDEENRLTQVVVPSGPTVNYKYDGLGRRIQRTTTAGANERYVYDGADALIDLNANWSVANTYFNGPGIDNHLRQTSNGTGVSYFLTDHLGSTAALTDAGGNVVEQIAYDSFGNGAGSGRTRYTYTGRERDSDSSVLYYRARFHDPQIGRFLSEDPLEFDGGLNWYSYVNDNAVNAIDPLGLDILIIEQGPTGNNPIGHTAIAITGRGVFSFGNGRELATDAKGNIIGGNLADYIYRESMNRETWLYIIKTTPAQDAAIEAALRDIAQNEPALQAASSIIFDNCSTRSNRALDEGGIPNGIPKTGRTLGPGVPGSAGQRARIAGSSGERIPKAAGWLPEMLAQFMR